MTEEEVRKLLVGKQLFLRGGYLDNTLSFNERGALIGHSPQGSYTLSAIEIDKVHLTKHKVELEGERYGLHFLGALPYEDPTKAVDRVNITPKKKVVKITIDRELVVKPKQEKAKKNTLVASKTRRIRDGSDDGTPIDGPRRHPPAPNPQPPSRATPGARPCAHAPAETAETAEAQNANEAQAEIAAAPAAERPADPKSVTTTFSQAHANKVLTDALDNIFAQGFDERMMASMPDFWKLYYEAAAAKSDYRPKILPCCARTWSTRRPADVDLRARIEPVRTGPRRRRHVPLSRRDRRRRQAGRNRGSPAHWLRARRERRRFHSQSHLPAGHERRQAGSGLLDLVVEFRIYSKRTAVTRAADRNSAVGKQTEAVVARAL